MIIMLLQFCVQIQLTDFENAAFVVFVVILTRAILSYGLDFKIPISKVRGATQQIQHLIFVLCIKTAG